MFDRKKNLQQLRTPAGEATGWGTPYDGLNRESVEKSVILLSKRPLIKIFRTDTPYSRIISILILSATCNENKTCC